MNKTMIVPATQLKLHDRFRMAGTAYLITDSFPNDVGTHTVHAVSFADANETIVLFVGHQAQFKITRSN